MRLRTTLAAALLALAGMPAWAHRLDEYLQGAIISVEKDRIQAQMTLTRGVAVFAGLFSYIDSDADGLISETEQRAYAAQVLDDLSLSIDGHRLRPQLLSIRFPSTDEMKEGAARFNSTSAPICLPAAAHENLFSRTITKAGFRPIR
jgi:hypothetical protein